MVKGDNTDAADCLELNPLPSVFCAFLSISGVLLTIERLFSTINYTKYEHEDFTTTLNRIFTALVRRITIKEQSAL